MKEIWSKEEINLLKELYLEKGLSLNELYPIFIQKFNRNKTGIKIKIVKLKLRHTEKQKFEIKSRLNSNEKNGMFGKKSWNKGLTKENNDILKENSKKLSIIVKNDFKNGKRNTSKENNGMFGKLPWNKGMTKYTNNKIKEMGENTSKIRKDMFKKFSENDWIILKNQLKKARLECKKKNTKIELKIKNLLIDSNISFIEQYPIDCFIVDFWVNNNFVIECLGDYWHCNPIKYIDYNKINNTQMKNLDRDKRKIKYFENNNIKYLLFWESDIEKNINLIRLKILEKMI